MYPGEAPDQDVAKQPMLNRPCSPVTAGIGLQLCESCVQRQQQIRCRPHPLSGVTSGAALGVVLVSMSGSSAGMPPSVPPAAKLRHAYAASCGEPFRGPLAWVTDSNAVTAAVFSSVVDCTAIVTSLQIGAWW